MKSIQQRLLTSLLIGLPLLWVLTSSFIAWKLWHEINEMNDTQITQVARYLIGVAPKEEDDKDHHRQRDDNKKHTPKIYALKVSSYQVILVRLKMTIWALPSGIKKDAY